MPHGQAAPCQALAGGLPRIGEIAGHFPREVAPEADTLWRRPHIVGRADLGVVNVNMLRGVLGIGGGGQQELTQPPLPGGAPVNEFVTDDEDRLSFRGQQECQQHLLPYCKWIGDEDLPQAENKR